MAAAAAPNAFREILEKSKVSDVMTPDRDILVVKTTDDPVEAFKSIVARGILSAPAYDPEAKKFVGFLDVKDLVSFVVFREEEKERDHTRKQNSAKNLLELPSTDIRMIFDVAARMYAQPAEGINIKYLARRHHFSPVAPTASLSDVVRTLGTEGVHRVPVVDPATGQVVDIISQSTLIQFVEKHSAVVSDLLGRTVDETKIGSRPVLPVRSTDTALATFQTMSKHNRSGVAVVDAESGRFVGNTSSSDLKLLLADLDRTQQLLNGSVLDFLSAVRQADTNPETRYPAIAVSRKTTIGALISKLAATRIHRIFIADDDSGFKPEAVVSITDVLRYLTNTGVAGTADKPLISVSSD